MKYTETAIKDVWLVEPVCHGDERGYFMETFRADDFRRATGLDVDFVQDNESFSGRGVVRGLHFQRGAHSQAKLVRVSQGAVLDVAVDLRAGSATYGRHVAVELSAENRRQLFIPRGFAHGFAVLSEKAQFQYKVDNYYAPGSEMTLLFSDPALGISWPFPFEEMQLSPKDLKGVRLMQLPENIFSY